MALTKYTYSISADTLNGTVDNKLKDEIIASAIVTEYDHLDVLGDVLNVWMKDALSGGDETILTGVVNTHTTHLPVIESLCLDGISKDFRAIDFKKELITGLYATITRTKGRITKVERFEDEAKTIPVVDEDIVYTDDALSNPETKTTTFTWYDTNGEAIVDTKTTFKIFDSIQKIEKAIKFRSAYVSQIKNNVLTYMMMTMCEDYNPPFAGTQTAAEVEALGIGFLTRINSEMSVFIESSDATSVITTTQNDSETWLDNVIPGSDPATTIREYVVYELSTY